MTSSRHKDWIAIQMDTPTNSEKTSDGFRTDSDKSPEKPKNREEKGKKETDVPEDVLMDLKPSEDDLNLQLYLETLKKVADVVLVDCSETIQYFLRHPHSIHPRWDPEVLRTWPEQLQLDARLLIERRMKAWRRKHPEKEDPDSQDELSFISDDENLEPSEDELTMEEVEKVKRITKRTCYQMESVILSIVMRVLKYRWNQNQKMYDDKLVGQVVEAVLLSDGFCWEMDVLSDKELGFIQQLVSDRYSKMKKLEKREMKQKKMMMEARERDYWIEKEKARKKSQLLMEELHQMFPEASHSPLSGTSEQLAMSDVVEAMKHQNLPQRKASQHLNPDVSVEFEALGDGAKGMVEIREQSQGLEEVKKEGQVLEDSILEPSETSEAPESIELGDARVESLINHPWIQKRIRKDSHGKKTCMTFRYRKFLDEEVRRRPLQTNQLPYRDFNVDEDGYLINSDSTHTVATRESDWHLGSFEDLGVENPEDGTDFDMVPEENAFRYRKYPKGTLDMFEGLRYSLYKEKAPKIRRGRNEVETDIWRLSLLRNVKVKLNPKVFENIPLTHGQPIELPTDEEEDLDDTGDLADILIPSKHEKKLQKYQEIHRFAHRRRRERRGDSELEDRILEVDETESSAVLPTSLKMVSRRRSKRSTALSKVLTDLLVEENGHGSLTEVADRLIKRMRSRIIRQQKDLRKQWYWMGQQKRKKRIHTKRYYYRCLYNSWKRTLQKGWDDLKVKADLICDMLERDQKPRPAEHRRYWDYSNPPHPKKQSFNEKFIGMTPKHCLMPISARYPEKFHPRQIFRYSDDQPDIWSDSDFSIGSGEIDLPRRDPMAHYEPGEVWSQTTISSTEGSEDSEEEVEGSEDQKGPLITRDNSLSLHSLSYESIASTDSLEYMFPVEEAVSESPKLFESPDWEQEKENLMEAENPENEPNNMV